MGKARAKKKPRRSDFGVKRQPLLEIRKFALSLHKSKLKPPQIVQVLTEKGTKVSPRTVQHWVKNAQKVCRSPGRPPLANAQRIVDKLDDLIEATGNAPSQQDFLEKLNEVATETFVAAGGTRRQFRNQQPMHRSTVLKYKKEAMLSPVQARFKPPARDEHGQSIRNPVVEFLLYDSLVHFYVEHPEWQVHPMNIQNIDPVSLAFNGESRIACFSTPKSRKKRKPPTRARAKTKPFTIKCLPLLMADGRIADPFIALMVCLDVPKGQIWKVKIPGFSPNTDGTGEIWLLRTLHGEDLRLANREFLQDVVFPSFKHTLSQTLSLPTRDHSIKEVGIFMFDGEREQLDEIINHKEQFKDLGVNGLKHCAGCSMFVQPNDVGHCHSLLHKYVQEGTYSRLFTQEKQDILTLTLKEQQSQLKFGKLTFNRLFQACRDSSPCLRYAFDPNNISSSFSRSGMWPLDFDQIVGRFDCKRLLDDERIDEIVSQVNEVRSSVCGVFVCM